MGYWQFFDRDSYTSIHCGGYPRGTDREVARLYADQTQPGLVLPAGGGGLGMGSSANVAGSGVALTRAAKTRAFAVYADDGGADLYGSGSVPDLRGTLSRLLVSHDQTGGHVRLFASQAQLKAQNVAWNTEVAAGAYGYLELVRASGTQTFGGYGKTAAVMGNVATSGTMTLGANHILAGVAAISSMRTGVTQTGKYCGIYVGKYDSTNWSDGTARTAFAYGLYLSGCVRGISFDGVEPPTSPGNYGQALDHTWMAVAGNGSFGSKLMYSNTATDNSVLYGLGLRCRAYYAGAKVVGLNVSASAAVANSGQVIGGQFYLQNSSTFTIVGGGGYPSTALYAKSWLDAACDKASALWIDDQSSVKATTHYFMDMTMNGSVQLDKVFHIYGGDPGANALFDFEACDQGGGFLTATSSGGLTRSHRLKVTVDGTTVGYMSIYTD